MNQTYHAHLPDLAKLKSKNKDPKPGNPENCQEANLETSYGIASARENLGLWRHTEAQSLMLPLANTDLIFVIQ